MNEKRRLKEFVLTRRRALGQKHGVAYAEAFHHIAGAAGGSDVDEYVKSNSVPVK
jgi:hypothetical protein